MPRSAGSVRGGRVVARLRLVAVLMGLVASGCQSSAGETAVETAPTTASSGSSGAESPASASEGSAAVSSTDGDRQASAEAPQRFYPGDLPFRGDPQARVVVQVFSDFECPFCSHAREYTERLLTDFPMVRFEYRHYPLSMHPHADAAAQAAVEAYAQGGNETFWCYHDAVFDHQHELSRERLLSLAGRCGVDRYTLERALDDRRHAARVERDRSEGQQLGVQGTPSFTVNGVLVEGGDYPALEEAVDRAL